MRPLNQELKEAIATIQAYPEPVLVERLQALKPAIETVISAQSSLDAAARWLVNVANTVLDLSAGKNRSDPDASSRDEGDIDTPDAR
jgi:hypothetical protein